MYRNVVGGSAPPGRDSRNGGDGSGWPTRTNQVAAMRLCFPAASLYIKDEHMGPLEDTRMIAE